MTDPRRSRFCCRTLCIEGSISSWYFSQFVTLIRICCCHFVMRTGLTGLTSIRRSSFSQFTFSVSDFTVQCRDSIIFQIISAELCPILWVKQGLQCCRCYVTNVPIFRHSIGCCCDRHATRHTPSAGEQWRPWLLTEFVTFDRTTSHRVNRTESEEMTSRKVDRRKGVWVLNGVANQRYFCLITTYFFHQSCQRQMTHLHFLHFTSNNWNFNKMQFKSVKQY